MTLLAGLALTLVFLSILSYKIRLAQSTANITGFLYNPLLYLLGSAYAYLVLGSMLSPAGQQQIGFVFYEDASTTASWLCYYTFSVIAVFYISSRERHISYTPFKLGIIGELSFFLILICLSFAYLILLKYGPGLALLQGSRYEAMKYYTDTFAAQGRYGQMYCVVIAVCLIYKIRFPDDWKSTAIFFAGTFPFLLSDYLQNARGTILGIFIIIYIVYCTERQKLYIIPAIIMFFALLAFGVVFRTDYKNMDISANTLSALSEFYLTRASVDYVVGSNTDMGIFHLFSASMDRIIPGIGKAIDNSGTLYFTDYIEKTMGLSFGLAGNIVSESYYYGGLSFSIVSPIIICLIYQGIGKSTALCFLPGFLLNIFLISSTQTIIRNGFYTGISTIIGVMLIYLSFITFFGRNIRVFRENTSESWQDNAKT